MAGGRGSRSKNVLEGDMMQMLLQGHTSEALARAREPGISST